MKLQVTQENLSKALNNVARVASTRNTLPILSNVLIKTTDNRVCIAATNLNIAITQYIGSKIKTKGSITVPARLTQDFVSNLPSGIIDLNLEDTKLHISTDKYKSVINGVISDDYPVMPTIQNGKKWSIASNKLKKALTQTVFSASNDDARPVLTGVYFNTHKNNLFIAATDSYRLAEKNTSPIKEDVSVLVPSSSIQDLLRILGDSDDEVKVVCDEQQIQFKIGDTELVTRLIEGNYPDYKKLIPNKFKTSAVADRSALLNTIKVSSLFARESAGSVVLEASTDDKAVTIRSVASQLGENTAAAEADVKGETGSITLNSRYLIDALSVMSGARVEIGFNDKLEPFVLRDVEDESYTHIVMPLKG
jgi:DNA polymerase III subunit beta